MSNILELKNAIEVAKENLKKAVEAYYAEVIKGNYTKDLSMYAGKKISSIKVIMDNDKIETFCDDVLDFIKVTADGYLYISDYNWGLLNYDSKKKTYIYSYHYTETPWNIKGFFDIEVRDD